MYDVMEEQVVVAAAQELGHFPRGVKVTRVDAMNNGTAMISWEDPVTGAIQTTVIPNAMPSGWTNPSLQADMDQSAKVRLEHTFKISWNVKSIDAQSEFLARAIVLVQDRLKDAPWPTHHPEVRLTSGNLVVKFSCPLDHLGQVDALLKGVQAEIDVFPQLGTAACPCGCGADLAIRECIRKRVAVAQGQVCVNAPAFVVRDAVHPDHAGHGIIGWVTDPVIGKIILACACGGILELDVTDANKSLTGESLHPTGGTGAEVLRQAVTAHYESNKARDLVLVDSRSAMSKRIQDEIGGVLDRTIRNQQDMLDAQVYGHSHKVDQNVPAGRAYMFSVRHGDMPKLPSYDKMRRMASEEFKANLLGVQLAPTDDGDDE
jgi:hypothetical protein